MGFLKEERKKQLESAREFTDKARSDFGTLGKGTLIIPPIRIDNPDKMFFGRNVLINSYGWIGAVTVYAGSRYEPRLEIGDNTSLGHGLHLFCCMHMIIGKDVMIADHVYISDNLHGYKDINIPPAHQSLKVPGPVIIGDQTWIGERVCILPNVTIGKHCVIGSNAVVTKDVFDYSVVAGIPAKTIKHYDFKKKAWVRL